MNLVMPNFVLGSWRVEDADGTEQIVVVVEARVDALEQEVAQMRGEWKDMHQAQIRVLNSLRVTQIEHGEILGVHSRAFGEIQGTLKEHGTILKEHGTAISEIQGTLKEHGTILKEHGTAIGEIRGT